MRRKLATLGGVAVLVVAGACGISSTGSGAAKHPKLPASAVGSQRSASMSAEASVARDSAGAADMSLAYPYRPIEYRLADKIVRPSRSAEAYRIVGDELTKARLGRLGDAFGVDPQVGKGDVVEKSVESMTDPQLNVFDNGVPMWNYSANGPDGSVSSGVAVACSPDGKCPEPPKPPAIAGLPTEDEAKRMARELLDKAGIDLDNAKFDVSGDESSGRFVNVTPVVGGQETFGLATSIAFGERGKVTYASGWLGRFESVGHYDLVDLPTALKRLQGGYFGFGGGREGGPAPMAVDSVAPSAGASEPKTVEGGGSGSSGAYPGCDPSGVCSTQPVPPPVPPEDPDGPSSPRTEPVMTIEPQHPSPPEHVEPQIVELDKVRTVLSVGYDNCTGAPTFLVPAYLFGPGDVGPVTAVDDADIEGGKPGDADLSEQPPCPGQDDPAGKVEPGVDVGRPEPAPADAPPDAPSSSPGAEPKPAIP